MIDSQAREATCPILGYLSYFFSNFPFDSSLKSILTPFVLHNNARLQTDMCGLYCMVEEIHTVQSYTSIIYM